jgi:hypothetical protein
LVERVDECHERDLVVVERPFEEYSSVGRYGYPAQGEVRTEGSRWPDVLQGGARREWEAEDLLRPVSTALVGKRSEHKLLPYKRPDLERWRWDAPLFP